MYLTNKKSRTARVARSSTVVCGTAATIPVFVQRLGSWQMSVQRLPFSAAELTHRYDRAAAGWSQIVNKLQFPHAYDMLLREAFSREAIGQVSPRVLDCGIGTGALSSALAGVLPTPFSLDGIDISPRMLEQARSCFDDTPIDVTFRRGDVRKLPYAADVFDIAMTSHVLEHLAEPGEALKEMVRVLKPGGLLIACITRRSILGALVQFKWRTHQVAPVQAENWLCECGLEDVHRLTLNNSWLCRKMSIAYIGKKPFIGKKPPHQPH